MKEQCMMCGSTVEDVSGVCPVCGAVLTRSTQVDLTKKPQFNLEQESGQPQQQTQQSGQPQQQTQQSGQPPFNYQNPAGGVPGYNPGMPGGPCCGTPKAPKKKVFAILSLVCSILSLLTCCVSGLGLALAIAAVVFAIVALVKKQIKAPAVIGMIIGIIALLLSIGTLCFNLFLRSMIGTNFNGMMEQLMETQTEGCTPLEDIAFLNPYDYRYYALYPDGSFDTDDAYTSGYYESYSYMDYYSLNGSTDVTYAIIYVMSQGYEIKDITILDFGSYECIFVVPDDYEAGDTIYYVQEDGYSGDVDNYQLVPVQTVDIDDLY